MLIIENYHKLLDQQCGNWIVTAMKEDTETNNPFYYITLESVMVSKSNGFPDVLKLELSRKKNEAGLYWIQSLNSPYIKEVSADNISTLLHIKFRILQYLKEANIE